MSNSNTLHYFRPPDMLLTGTDSTTLSGAKKTHSSLHTLQANIATYYNQSTPDFTSPKHVVVGAHKRSLLFLLHLACKTFNECASNQQPHLTMRQHTADTIATTLQKPTLTPRDSVINVLSFAFPNTARTNQNTTSLPQPCVLVAELPQLFTGGTWSCAFAVFPHLARSHEQTIYTAIRNIVRELQTEVGAVPTTITQQRALLACSPMVLAFAARCHVLACGVSMCIANTWQAKANERGVLCTVVPTPAEYPNSRISTTIKYDSLADAEKLEFMLEQLISQEVSASTTIHWKRTKHDVHIWWTGTATSDPNRVITALPDVDSIVDGVETEWVATQAFVEEWMGGVWKGGEVVGKVV